MSLDVVVSEVSRRSLDDALFYLADPKKSNFTNGLFPNEIVDDVSRILAKKFEDGWSILQELIKDCIEGCTSIKSFESLEVANSYDLLEALMNSRPKEMVDRTKALYGKYEKGAAERRRLQSELNRGKIKPEDLTLIELSHYTHKWRQNVEKPSDMNPFGYLKGPDYRFGRGELFVKSNPNSGYPKYPIHSWIVRLKSDDRTIEKFLEHVMIWLISSEGSLPYNQQIRDYFGGRLIALDRSSQPKIERTLYYNGKWTVVRTRDQRKELKGKGREVPNFVYTIYRNDRPDILLDLQFVPLPDTLLYDFFAKDRHDAYQIRRSTQLQAYRRHNVYGVEYTRMEYNLLRVLGFLKPRIITS